MRIIMTRKIYILIAACVLSVCHIPSAQALYLREYTEEHPLVIVSDWEFPPYEFRNDKGEPDGYNVEVLDLILNRLSIPHKYVMKEWYKCTEAFENREADIIHALAFKYQMRPYVMTQNMITYYNVRCARLKTTAPITSLEQLTESDTLVLKKNDYAALRVLEMKDRKFHIEFHSSREALTGIHSGKYRYYAWGEIPLSAKQLSSNASDWQEGQYLSYLLDGDPSTFFWSDSSPKAGSYFTVDLGQVTDAPGVSLMMGAAGHTDDYVRNGVIEYSTDGVTYTKLCDLNGKSTIETDQPFTARYLRLRVTSNQSYWAIIAEFGVKSASEQTDKKVTTDLAIYQNYLPDLAIDGDPSTFFWSNGAPGAGSHFTVDLGAELEVAGVELTMGAAGHTDDYIRAGVIEYSTDGENYTKLCELDGTKTLKKDGSFTARYVRLRCTASQSNWVIITEFAMHCATDLPDGFSFEGSASCNFSPLFDRDLFNTFSPSPAIVSGGKLYIDLTSVTSVELYLASASGLRVYTVDGDGKTGADLPLSLYMAPDLEGAARLCIEFTSERADVAEIVIS